jgi:hypothetical protein
MDNAQKHNICKKVCSHFQLFILKKRITFYIYFELTKHNVLPMGGKWVWTGYSSGSQPVCRGTFLYRELLPNEPQGFKKKNDYTK